MRWERYLGGMSAYLISSRGARKLVDMAEKDGRQTGIDVFVMLASMRLHAFECDPPLATAPVAIAGDGTDSDIQHDAEPVAPASVLR